MSTYTWLAGVNGLFNVAADWTTGVVPGSADTALITLAGSVVNANANATINTLAVAAGNLFTVSSGTFTINSGTAAGGIAGTVTVGDGAVLQIGGAIVNSGTINESSAGAATQIVFTQTTNTLQGGGQIILSANSGNQLYATNSTFQLINVNNTISGSGNIGESTLALTNQGIINANQATAGLTINTGANIIINSGTLEATAGGDLSILSAVNNIGGTIAAVGAGSTIYLQGSVTGGLVTASGGGVIQYAGGSAALDGLGLHPVTLGTPIQIADNTNFTLYGTIINNAAINLNSTGDNTQLLIGSPIVTLKGTGAINLTNFGNNEIYGNQGAYQLINQGNTITGAGSLGWGQLTFINQSGVVNANKTTALVLNTNGNLVTNKGTLQASNTGGLYVNYTAIVNTGGTVEALVAGSHVDLANGSTIQGGTVITANGGVIQTVYGNGNGGLDGITSGQLTITSGSVVKATDQTNLYLAGTINNLGTIQDAQTSVNGTTGLIINSQTVTLQGGGQVQLSNNSGNVFYGSSKQNTLVNVNNTISGAGQLGYGQLTLVNQSGGVINANQAASLSTAGQLVLNTNGNLLTNQGLIESTNTGGLYITYTTINNAGGTVEATGSGHIDLANGSSIQGGLLTILKGGVVQTVGGNGGADGITVGVLTNAGTITINDQTYLYLAGTINNSGTIAENQVSSIGSTRVILTGQNVTLQSGGQVVLSDNVNNLFYANNATNTLYNVNNTISGAGQFGNGQLTFVNQSKGVVNATGKNALVLNTNGRYAVNTGLLEGTGFGGLNIYSTTIINTGGTVSASGIAGHVDLTGGSSIEGGALVTSGAGVIQTIGGNSATLDGFSKGVVTNTGTVLVNDNSSLYLYGVINNTGTIASGSLGSYTNLIINAQVTTLTGGGQILLSNWSNNRIYGSNGGNDLINVNNTIAGSGQLGAGGLTLVNQAQGTINANQLTALVLNTGQWVATNLGTLESTSSQSLNGGLVIQSTVNNAGGSILANGPIAHVELDGGYIEGGTLGSSLGGAIRIFSGHTGTLDGITAGALTNTGTVLISDGGSLGLYGTIKNTGTGTILEDAESANAYTYLRLNGQTETLTGPGSLALSDNANNIIVGNGNTLVNQGTITGAGNFGYDNLELKNSGLINGNATNTLIFRLGQGSGGNTGIIEASGAGGVYFASGYFTNTGTLWANDGSKLYFDTNYAANTNLNEGDLVGGTWKATAVGHGATLSVTGGPILRDAATIVLSGSASVLQAWNGAAGWATLEQSLGSITAGGQLQLLAARGYGSSLGLIDSGLIQLAGGTFQTSALNIASGGKLVGFGTVQEAVTNAGLLEAQGGTLKVTGAIAGTGGLQIDNAAVFEVGAAASVSATYAAGAVGTLKLDLPGSFSGAVNGLTLGDVIDLAGVTALTATVNAAGTVLTVTRTVGAALTYNVAGALIGNHFVISSDGAGGSNLTLTAGVGAALGGGGKTGKPVTFGPPPPIDTWKGGTDTNYNTATNWSTGSVAGSGNFAAINATVTPATIVSAASNTVDSLGVTAGNTLSLIAGTFTATNGTGTGSIAGTLAVSDGAALNLGGTIVNSGTIAENSAGTATAIVFTQTTNTLSGGGKVVLSANTNNLLYASNSAYLLVNVNDTISGAGNIGNGQLLLTNQAVINATQTAAALTLNTGGNVIINTGTLEATAGGDLNVLSAVNNTGGTIAALGAGSTVYLQGSVTGGTVTASGGGVIQYAGGSGALDGLGLHPVTLGAAVQIADNTSFWLYGTIINNAAINLNSTGDNTQLQIGSPIVTLQGTGSINLSNFGNNLIYGYQGAYQLINQGNTIDGAGQLGNGQLTFYNLSGVVNANQTTALVLNTNGNVAVNSGTLESTNTGDLYVTSTAIVNTGGTVAALVAGSHVDLANGSTIQGGTLITANGGVIQTVSGNGGLDGITSGVLTNTGLVKVTDQTSLYLAGTINNTGTIWDDEVSINGNTQIILTTQTVTLTGGGQVVLSNSGGNLFYGSSNQNTLVNVNNTISGAGQLGWGQLTLVNQAGGVINANQAPSFTTGGTLVLNTNGNLAINQGLIESTNAGGLYVTSTTINNAGGTVQATGNGIVDLANGSSIQGGLVTTAGKGLVQTASGNGTLDGFTSGVLTNAGLFKVYDQTYLYLLGAINNTGTIWQDQVSRVGTTRIIVNSQNVTLQGGGQLVLSNNGNNVIYGSSNTNTLLNLNETISGAGELGWGQLTFINAAGGLVNANQTRTLTLNTNGIISFNAGTLEGTNSGGLDIHSTVLTNTGTAGSGGGTVVTGVHTAAAAAGTGGTILAAGALGVVYLSGGTSIQGGTLNTTGGGVIEVTDNATLDGITAGVITNLGTVQVDDGATLYLYGPINNTGVIYEAAYSLSGSTTDIIINAQTTTLLGGGQILLSDNGSNRIYSSGGGGNTLINVNNTISGGGQIGNGQLTLVNQAAGIINATGGAALIISTGQWAATNQGLIESTSAVYLNGGLQIDSTIINTGGGTILAAGALAHVDLVGGYIEGGTLATTGGGVIQTLVNSTGYLDGITAGALTNLGTVVVNDTSSLGLYGTIVNSGTIYESAFSNTSNTFLRLNGQTETLTGAGALILSDSGNNVIVGNGNTLVNQSTISGAGNFGYGSLDFTNSGLINATGANTLNFSLGQGSGVNTGTIEATGTGGISFSSGYYTNTGTFLVTDGSSLAFDTASAANTNLNEGDLVGGTWKAVANGHGAILSVTGGPIVRDAAVIVLTGAGSVLRSWNSGSWTTVEQSLGSIVAGGQLQVLGNRGFVGAINLIDSGLIVFGGGTFQTSSLAITTGGRFVGSGTLNEAVSNAGTVEVNTSLLSVTVAVTGTGTLQADAGATLTLGATGNQIATVVNKGTVNLAASATLVVSGAVTPASSGVFLLNSLSVLEVATDQAAGSRISFLGATDRLVIDHAALFGTGLGLPTYTGPALLNFGGGDQVDLKDIAYSAGLVANYTAATGLLQIKNGSANVATLLFNNPTLGSGAFHFATDGAGGTLLTHS